MQHSYTHSHTNARGNHARHQPAHQEQLGVQSLAQRHLNTHSGGAWDRTRNYFLVTNPPTLPLSHCRPTQFGIACWRTSIEHISISVVQTLFSPAASSCPCGWVAPHNWVGTQAWQRSMLTYISVHFSSSSVVHQTFLQFALYVVILNWFHNIQFDL